jgi:uncharacterized protein (DUF1778 family)
MTTDEKSRPLIKFAVPQQEHDLIRLAGALQRTSMAQFVRTTVIAEAKRVTADIKLPASDRKATTVGGKGK